VTDTRTCTWTGRVGKGVHRELLLVVARLQGRGIDVNVREISRGWFTVDYQVTFTGDREQEREVDFVFEQLKAWANS
jgi:hypothetical protein